MNIGLKFCGKEKYIAGVNRVIYETVNEILRIDNRNEYFSIDENYFKFPIEGPEFLVKSKMDKVQNIWLYYNNVKIIHSYYNAFSNLEYKCNKIMTIHDMIPLIHSDWFGEGVYEYFDKEIRKSVEQSDIVMAVSESTKRDVVEHFNYPEERVRVIYPGLYSALDFNDENNDDNILHKYGILDEYILSVCTIEPRKNLRGLIQAFANYKRKWEKSHLKLVLTGKAGWDHEFEAYLESLGKIKNDIILTGYVSEKELSCLYLNATAFAYVSFYEGFGLPILEAMAAGKVVITSNTSSMPEVGGDAVLYCNPYEIESITDCIEQAINNGTLRSELQKRAIERSKIFTYRETALNVLHMYDELK